MRLVARHGLILCAVAARRDRAGAGLPDAAGDLGRALCGGRRRRLGGTAAGAEIGGEFGQSWWWRTAWARQYCRRIGRQGGARRPHAIHGTSTQLAIQVTLHKKLPYDPATDFAPIALVASVPFVLLVHPALPVNSVADLGPARQGEARDAHLRLERRRRPAASLHRAPQDHDRHAFDPRSLQGHGAGDQ